MRLINVHTNELEFFQDERTLPPYAILSHMWTDKEVSYADLFDYQARFKDLDYAKIRLTCEQAKRDSFDYVWVDTVCIDKSSSSELTEAINSMFRWYEKSSVCYVYMNDVGLPSTKVDPSSRGSETRHDSILRPEHNGSTSGQLDERKITAPEAVPSEIPGLSPVEETVSGIAPFAAIETPIRGQPEVTLRLHTDLPRRPSSLISPSDGKREDANHTENETDGQSDDLAEDGVPAQTTSDASVTRPGFTTISPMSRSLKESRWFTRGFTLQELLAPTRLTFYDHDWKFMGGFEKVDANSSHKPSDLSETITNSALTFSRDAKILQDISDVTGIPEDVLMHRTALQDVGVATKMSWAAYRETTRLEDEAYCLLGIFDINMPMLYGEGKKAFARLQQEIIRTSTDQTVFAWNGPECQLLAPSPASFAKCASIVPRDRSAVGDTYEMTNRGLRITLPVIREYYDNESKRSHSLAILDCVDLNKSGHCICLALPKSQPGLTRGKLTEVDLQEGHGLIYVPFKSHRDRAASPALAKRQQLLILHTHRPAVTSTTFYAQISVLDDRGRYSCQCYPDPQWDMDSLTTLMDQDSLPEPRVVHLHRGRGAGALIAFGISLGPSPQHVYFSLKRHRGMHTQKKVDQLIQRLQNGPLEGPNAVRWAYLPVTRSIIVSWSTKVEIEFQLASVGQNRDGWMIVLQPRQTRLRRWVGLGGATAFLPVALPWMILSRMTEGIFGREPKWLTTVCNAHGAVIDKCVDGAFVFRHP